MTEIPPRKARLVDLHRPGRRGPHLVTTPEAFGRIARECLDQWHANETLLLSSRSVPHLHQMRVGIRRLRSSFSLFRAHVPALAQGRGTVVTLREATLPFGRARDLDVLLGGPLATQLTERQARELAAEREAAYDVTLTILTSLLWRHVTDDVHRLVEEAERAPGPVRSIRKVASAALDKRWRRIAEGGTDLAGLTPQRRHEIRIEAKKLRYGFEFFHSLYAASAPVTSGPDDRAASGALACAAVAEDLQTTLGLLNDHAIAERLLYSVGSHAPDIDEAELIAAAQEAQRAVAGLDRIWA